MKKIILCEKCGSNDFEVRLKRDDCIGLITCKYCRSNYFLLDSKDYWYDCTQDRYPSATKCACKNTSFAVEIDYEFRSNGDVKFARIDGACNSCHKHKKLLVVEIDYGPTTELIEAPLTICEVPHIKYELKEINMFLRSDDILKIVDYARSTLSLDPCCFRWGEDDPVDELNEIYKLVEINKYSKIYLLDNRENLVVPLSSAEDREFIQKNEVIRLSSPYQMFMEGGNGYLYYFRWTTQFVESWKAKDKSEKFRRITKELETWLAQQYVGWRGKHALDNAQEHIRLFGNKYKA